MGIYNTFLGGVGFKPKMKLGFHKRNSFSHSCGGWESKVKVSAGWVSLPGLPKAASLLCPHMVLPLQAHPWHSFCISKFPLLMGTAVKLD